MIGEAWMSNVKFCSIIFHLNFFFKPFRLISIFSSSLPLPPIFFYFFSSLPFCLLYRVCNSCSFFLSHDTIDLVDPVKKSLSVFVYFLFCAHCRTSEGIRKKQTNKTLPCYISERISTCCPANCDSYY